MTPFAVHDAATGRILRTGRCPASQIDAQAAAGEAAVAVAADVGDATHRIVAGAAVAYPARPGDWAVWDFEAGEWTDPRGAEHLARARAAATARANAAAGARRLVWITDLPGQVGVYLDKEREARAWLAASPPPASLAAFPYMQAEIGITAPDAASLAALWVARADHLRLRSGAIEGARMAATIAIAVAPDETAIAGAEAALAAALAAIPEP